MTQLDLTGPFEVFSRTPGVTTHLLWKTLDPVRTEMGLTITPTSTFDDCPPLDLVCVPGGPGTMALMEDQDVLRFLSETASTCHYITAVCTGSLVLGAAGLLKGYRVTTHWAVRDQLALLGAEAVDGRVVFDRNRITGAGVTSGIDFALAVVAHLVGDDVAKHIQLLMEYDPKPPIAAGCPASAGPLVTAEVLAKLESIQVRRREVTRRAAAALNRVKSQNELVAEGAMKKIGLSPMLDQNTEVLILGSLPSDISLSKEEYYANRNNDFWKILTDVLGQPLTTLPYGERRLFLLAHKIGLWDVYHHCVRPGSMDKNISEQEANNFKRLKVDAPKLKLVCFNGEEAGESQGLLRGLSYETIVLPSSSGANRKNQELRLNFWRSALQPWKSRMESAHRAIEKAFTLMHFVQTLEGTDKDGVEHLLERALENLRMR